MRPLVSPPRVRHERPRRRTTEQRYELAASHCPMPPVLRTEILRRLQGPGIGEIDRAVGFHHHIVWAVEPPPLKAVRQNRETAVELAPRHAPSVVRLQREQGPSSHVFMTERDGPMTPKAYRSTA